MVLGTDNTKQIKLMNAKDRDLIARILDGIASDDRMSVAAAGEVLLELRPEIIEDMEHSDWWGIISENDKDVDASRPKS